MDQGHPLPLRVDFIFSTQAKSFDTDHVGDVGKHGFDRAQALTVNGSAFVGVSTGLMYRDVRMSREGRSP